MPLERSPPPSARWKPCDVAEVAEREPGAPGRGRARRRRQARGARARPARPARRRPRADRGLPRPREDADRALVRAGDEPRLRPDPVHAGPDALRRHRLLGLQPAHRRVRVPARADLRQPPPRRRDQPRPTEDAGGAARSDAGAPGDDRGRDAPARRARSSCSRPRTRSSTRARTRCPRRSSTASCCGSRSATRRARTSSASSSSAATARTDEVQLQPGRRRRDPARDAAGARGRPRLGDVGGYIVDVVRGDAGGRDVQVGASPRGTLAILKLARAPAALDGRDFVVPDDVKAVAGPALAHRLALRPELWVQQVRAEDVVAERLATVPTPPAEER